ncbi:MAG: DNA methyltransferase [Planctomycetes bacterium]|nr:DNA methyltransferase [Planctomycetota bacterium]MDP6424676.1 DNA adenine methylase [Planctomycetota bacterium]
MIKYIGSKRVLVPRIVEIVRGLAPRGRVLDLFSGTARVGHALKSAGYDVVANDHNSFAHRLATCYVAADAGDVAADAGRWIGELNRLKGDDGWFTETYCRQSRYFRPENGARVEAIRNRIAAAGLPFELESVLLVSLMEAADRVDSTTGVQMAYLKSWAPRALNELELRLPRVLPGRGEARQLDASEAAARFEVDVAYVDPPYNQHSYLGNYHVWETLVLWDAPEVYGVARKRVDCRTRKSRFNSRPGIRPALLEVLGSLRAKHVVVSFNDEGYVSPAQIRTALEEIGKPAVVVVEHKRYVGAQIGIHNQRGIKVGTPGKRRNREMLFVVSAEPQSGRRMLGRHGP